MQTKTKDHNCLNHMMDKQYECYDDMVLCRSTCDVCGRKLVETYEYVETIDQETGEILDTAR